MDNFNYHRNYPLEYKIKVVLHSIKVSIKENQKLINYLKKD